MSGERSWNIGGTVAVDSDDRARQRAEMRERRAEERSAMAQARTDRRTAEREQAAREREEMREARRIEQADRMKALRPDPEVMDTGTPAEPKRRASGAIRRTGEVRVERDTRHYATRVDIDRIRLLARRGATLSSLAAVFGISEDEVAAALADPESAEG